MQQETLADMTLLDFTLDDKSLDLPFSFDNLNTGSLGSFDFLDATTVTADSDIKENLSFMANSPSPQTKVYSEQEKLFYKQKLIGLVNYYKKHLNNGFGLIPVSNSFTAKHKYQYQEQPVSLRRDSTSEILAMLSCSSSAALRFGEDDFLKGLSLNKKKDFCSKLKIREGMKTILFEVEFAKKGRWGLFQGVDFLVETGESVSKLIGQPIIMEMDGGIDLAILRTVEYMPLVGGIQEVPFMPMLRRPTHFDLMKYESKANDELVMLNFCRELLKYPEFSEYNMKVIDVEFQIDRKKLIIFAEFVTKVRFNRYVKHVYENCKMTFKKRNIKPRVFIQNKFISKRYQ